MKLIRHIHRYFKRYICGLVLLVILAALILAALWQAQRQDPCYQLFVNFDGVSTTPNWSYLQKLLYSIDYENWDKGRFGLKLVAGNEFDFNRFPCVPPGPCKIEFKEMCYYVKTHEDGSERMKIVVDLPRPDSGDDLEVYAESCPGLVAVMADAQCRTRDLHDCERIMPPAEAADTLGMLIYPAESGDTLSVPFKDGKLSLHLIIKDERDAKGWHAHSVVISPLKK